MRRAIKVGRIAANLLIVFGVVAGPGGQLLQGGWMSLIGWFLDQGARASYQRLVLRNAPRGVRGTRHHGEDRAHADGAIQDERVRGAGANETGRQPPARQRSAAVTRAGATRPLPQPR